MSQHHIDSPQYEIIVGWDRPLQYFFATVFDKESGQKVVFTTLELPGGGARTIEQLSDVLRTYLNMPDELLNCLEEDRVNNRGNVVRRWAVGDAKP
jgi:hypothetical protein